MRTVAQANRVAWRQWKQKTRIKARTCKKTTREWYDIPSDGSPNARVSYSRTKHRFTGYWVPGAFAWWKIGEDWHVAKCAYKYGYVYTTDLYSSKEELRAGNGRVYRAPLGDVHTIWGATFLGFSLDIDGKTPVKMPKNPKRYPA